MNKCVECGEEFDTLNYKHKLCPKCYKTELEKAIDTIKEELFKLTL